MQRIPIEIAHMIYKHCDSLGRMGLYVSMSGFRRLGVRPPVRQNVILAAVKTGCIRLVQSACLNYDSDLVMQTTDPEMWDALIPFFTTEIQIAYCMRKNLQFMKYCISNRIHIKNWHLTYSKRNMILYCETCIHYKTPPDQMALEHIVKCQDVKTIQTMQNYGCTWQFSKISMSYIYRDVYDWLLASDYPHTIIAHIVDYRPEYVLEHLELIDHDIANKTRMTKLMQILPLEIIQQHWDQLYNGSCFHRMDVFMWALHHDLLNFDYEFNHVMAKASVPVFLEFVKRMRHRIASYSLSVCNYDNIWAYHNIYGPPENNVVILSFGVSAYFYETGRTDVDYLLYHFGDTKSNLAVIKHLRPKLQSDPDFPKYTYNFAKIYLKWGYTNNEFLENLTGAPSFITGNAHRYHKLIEMYNRNIKYPKL